MMNASHISKSIFAVQSVPFTEQPGGLTSMGLHGVGHNGSGLEAAAAAPFNLHPLQDQSASTVPVYNVL